MGSTRRLRAGVVGFGWAGQQHIKGYAKLDDVDLVAICGMEDDAGAKLAAEHDVPTTFRDLGTMLAEADLDVVSIATPTATHAPLAIQAMDAGVHVLSEKPIAETADHAAEMVAASRRNDRVLEVSYNHRRRGVVTALKDAVDDKLLGDVYYAKAGWLRRSGIPGLGTWFTRKASAGGGPFMDIGVHMLDMAMHLLDEPDVATVSASTYAEFGPRGLGGSAGYRGVKLDHIADYEVEDLATAFCRLDSGATLLLEASWAQWVPHDLCYVDLYGRDGGAHLEWGPGVGENGALVIRTDIAGRAAEITPNIPPSGGHDACVAEFCATVRSEAWESAHGDLSLTRARLIDAAYASADRHREVALAG